MNMITAFSIPLQLHGILLTLILLILDFSYLVVVVEASLKSNLGKIPKHTCSCDKVSSHLGGIPAKSSKNPPRRLEFLKKGEISPR